METKLVKIATVYANINEQLNQNTSNLVALIEQGNKQYKKMDFYLKTLQHKLQQLPNRTPEQEKHLQEITAILNP